MVRAAFLTCVLGTTMVVQDVATLSRNADAVVHGKVTRIESRWSGDHARIVTEVTVEVVESLKGAPGKTVTIVQPGGVVGDVGQRVDGVASFAEGEEVVVFLEKRPDARFLVAGMAQGKFRVERSSDGKSAFATPDVAAGDAMLVDPLTRQPVAVNRAPVTLDALKRAIAAAKGPNVSPELVKPAPKGP